MQFDEIFEGDSFSKKVFFIYDDLYLGILLFF